MVGLGAGDPGAGGDKGTVQALGEGQVEGVVEAEAVAKLPGAGCPAGPGGVVRRQRQPVAGRLDPADADSFELCELAAPQRSQSAASALALTSTASWASAGHELVSFSG